MQEIQDKMKRIFLVGYMGAGKTTVGKVLSKRMGLTFIDLDHFIEGRYHKSIRQIFAEKGEEEFRRIEQRILHEVAAFEDVLVATGGGAPCFFDNMEFMNENGQTVYLKVSPEELTSRLEVCKATRPVLKNRSGDELKAFVTENLDKRAPFYEKASILFDAEQMMTEKDISVICERLHDILY